MNKKMLLIISLCLIISVVALFFIFGKQFTQNQSSICSSVFQDTSAEIVTAAEVEERIAAKCKLFLLDVRESDEYFQGHISGSVNIPLRTLEERLSEIPKEDNIITICRSENRSRYAMQWLRARGYSRAQNLGGGMLAWRGKIEY